MDDPAPPSPDQRTSDLIPRFDEQGYGAGEIEARRRWIEERTGASLRHIGAGSVPGEEMRGNVENPIGAAQVPIGVAGPLRVAGEHARGTFYVPLATTEGVFACPEGAATVAALQVLRQQEWIQAHERVVLFNTGSGLKYADLLHATPPYWDDRDR